jgi:hypothetical protein
MNPARWHLGQLVMATIGAVLAGGAIAIAVVAAGQRGEPQPFEVVGYAGDSLEQAQRITGFVDEMNRANPAERRDWLVASGVPDSVIAPLLTGYRSGVEIVRAGYVANGGIVDTSAVTRYNARQTLSAWIAGVIALVGIVWSAVWWWRWFGARAPDQVSRSGPSDALEAEAP